MKKFLTMMSICVLMLTTSVMLVACGGDDDPTPPAEATAPGAVASFSVTGDATSVTLNWTAPADDGGETITGYQITTDNWATQTNKTAAQFTHSFDVTIGTTYTFKIRAANAKGSGTEKAITVEVEKHATPTGMDSLDQNIKYWMYDENVTSYTLSGTYAFDGDTDSTEIDRVITLGDTVSTTQFAISDECYIYDASDFIDGIGWCEIFICANGNTRTTNGTLYLQSATAKLYEY